MLLLENIVADMAAEDAEMAEPEFVEDGGSDNPYQIRDLGEEIFQKYAWKIANEQAKIAAPRIGMNAEQLAEELKQAALEAAVEKAPNYDPNYIGKSVLPSTFSSYIYNQMQFGILNYLRRYYKYSSHERSIEDFTFNRDDGDEGTGNLLDFIPDENAPDPRKGSDESDLQDIIASILSKMPLKLRQYIELRFGLGNRRGEDELTNSDIAKMYGISTGTVNERGRAAIAYLTKELLAAGVVVGRNTLTNQSEQPAENKTAEPTAEEPVAARASFGSQNPFAGCDDETTEKILSRLPAAQRLAAEYIYSVGSRKGEPPMRVGKFATEVAHTSGPSVSRNLRSANQNIQRMLLGGLA